MQVVYDPRTGLLKPWWKRAWGIVVLVVVGIIAVNALASLVLVSLVSD